MIWHKETLIIHTHGKGLHPITNEINEIIKKKGIKEGICFLFIQHTSASIIINESYDPTARMDMENFMEKLVPENQSWYRHVLEGSDDSPSHIRSILTQTGETIPIDNGKLNLGIWQGIYLFEHRSHEHRRKILIRCLGV